MKERHDGNAESLPRIPCGKGWNVRIAGFDEIGFELEQSRAPAAHAEREAITVDQWNGETAGGLDAERGGLRIGHEQRVSHRQSRRAEPVALREQVALDATTS